MKKETYQEITQAGWQVHPGTYCGHYFDAGEIISLCKKERRTSDGKLTDKPNVKCVICEQRLNQPRTRNLFT